MTAAIQNAKKLPRLKSERQRENRLFRTKERRKQTANQDRKCGTEVEKPGQPEAVLKTMLRMTLKLFIFVAVSMFRQRRVEGGSSKKVATDDNSARRGTKFSTYSSKKNIVK